MLNVELINKRAFKQFSVNLYYKILFRNQLTNERFAVKYLFSSQLIIMPLFFYLLSYFNSLADNLLL